MSSSQEGCAPVHLKTSRPYSAKVTTRHNQRAREAGCPGKLTRAEWEALKAKHEFTCLRCGRREPWISLGPDHIIPLSDGGSNNIDNIQPLCRTCNTIKRRRHTDYREGMPSDNKSDNPRFEDLRISRGLTYAKLAAELKTALNERSRTTTSVVMIAIRGTDKYSLLRALSAILCVSTDELAVILSPKIAKQQYISRKTLTTSNIQVIINS